MRDRLGALMRDRQGKMPVKMVFGATILAIGVAVASPGFRANPYLAKAMGAVDGDMETVLPDTLNRVTEALKQS